MSANSARLIATVLLSVLSGMSHLHAPSKASTTLLTLSSETTHQQGVGTLRFTEQELVTIALLLKELRRLGV